MEHVVGDMEKPEQGCWTLGSLARGSCVGMLDAPCAAPMADALDGMGDAGCIDMALGQNQEK